MVFNRLKTVILLAAMSSLILLLGNAVGGSSGLTIAFAIALLMNVAAYFFSDKLVLSMYGAIPLDEQRYAHIHTMVEQLAQGMHIPKPKLWLVQTPMANAFATGRNPAHASVAVTTGILSILDARELRGVLAHELSHVKNRDILVSTIAATLATTITYLAHMLRFAAYWAPSDGKRRSNPIVLFLIALFMPLAATLLQLAISRSREYLADEDGAHECKDPLALALALEKLHMHIPQAHLDERDEAKASTAPLFIVHPFSTQGLIGLFSTHPPLQERIARLHALARKNR